MRKKRRFKINNDTMTTIVVSSLLFCVAVIIVGIVLQCLSIDISTITGQALTLFGTELGVCGLMTIFNRYADRQDKREAQAAERREARMKRGLGCIEVNNGTEGNSTESING